MTKPSANIARRNLAALAREHGPKAIDVLVAALNDADPRVRIDAANKLLDRGIGKPTQPTGGDDEFDAITTKVIITGVPRAGDQ